MSLKTTINVRLQTLLLGSLDNSTPEDRADYNLIDNLLSGTGVGQADVVFHDRRTLTGISAEELDLWSGGLVDPLGAAIKFAKVKLLMVRVRTVTTGTYLEIGGAGLNPFYSMFDAEDDMINLGPGGLLLLYNPDGYAAGSSADKLRIGNTNGFSIEYDIFIVGTSA
jgi:hypothetical protein